MNNTELDQRMPPEYKLAGRWQLEVKGWALVTMLAGGVLVFGLSSILGIVIRSLFRGVYEGQISIDGLIFFPITLGAIIATLVLHEAVHGLLFLIQGGKPRFGFKLIGYFFPVAYATSTVRLRVPRNKYFLVGLGPFLILTPIFLVTGVLVTSDNIAVLVLMAMAMNVSGSIGDFMVAHTLLRHDHKTLFEDTEDGFNWYIPSSRSHDNNITLGELCDRKRD